MSLNTPLTRCFPAVETPTLRQVWPSPHPNLPTAVTLFSGLGSASKALRDLGFRVLAHDFMREACSSLVENGFDVVQGDIRAVDFSDPIYRNVQVVVGGPPCQPFSQGGRNAGENDPRDMIPDFQRCVAEILPRFFILENVRGLASPRHKDYLERRVAEFEAIGYTVEWKVLDSADHGVGQSRKRLFLMGVRVDVLADRARDPFEWRSKPIIWPHRKRQRTMADVLGWTPTTCRERNLLAPEAAHDDEKALWPMARPATTVVGSFRPEVQAAPGYRSAGDGPRQNAPGSVVTTPEERLVLQGMPRDWKVVGSKGKVDLQIGNSCPNPLLNALLIGNVR